MKARQIIKPEPNMGSMYLSPRNHFVNISIAVPFYHAGLICQTLFRYLPQSLDFLRINWTVVGYDSLISIDLKSKW